MRMYEAAPGIYIPEGQTLATMYQGDAMMNQAMEICGIDSLLEPDQVERDSELSAEIVELLKTHWRVRGGAFLAVNTMSDAHVLNTVKYLRRNGFESPTMPALLEEVRVRGLDKDTAPKPKVTVVKCPCGDKVCKSYWLSEGNFYQGCGWSEERAQQIADAINIYDARAK